MRALLLIAIMLAASPAAAQRGVVNGIRVSSDSVTLGAAVTMRVTGTNPCGAVFIDQGDGTAVTHPIEQVPTTINYTYSRPGTYRLIAKGMGNCDGEATTTITVTPARGEQQAESVSERRFRAMDGNDDGVITRAEWRGSEESFRVHDWNSDGVLSGNEVRPNARRPARDADERDFDPENVDFDDWTEARFRDLDHNRDGQITRAEWHFDVEPFRRADRNRDGALSRSEFIGEGTDDDREDRFRNLDANRNGRVEWEEWHGSRDAFDSLDTNRDRVLSRAEVAGEESGGPDLFARLDVNRDRRISPDEWHWSRRSFNQRDDNGDGVLTRNELSSTERGAVGTSGEVIVVDSTRRWTDTGLSVRAGDTIMIDAQGSVQLSSDGSDIAGPAGARSGRRAPQAPLVDQPAGALIARIGDSAPLSVGARGSIARAPASGRLYLGVNDDHLADNRGEFRVSVSIQRRNQ